MLCGVINEGGIANGTTTATCLLPWGNGRNAVWEICVSSRRRSWILLSPGHAVRQACTKRVGRSEVSPHSATSTQVLQIRRGRDS